MRKWGIYCLADGEMLPSLYDSEQEAWRAIDECASGVDLSPVPVLLGGLLPSEPEEEPEVVLEAFKVEYLSSSDFEERVEDPSAPVTVLWATVEADGHDDAILKTHEKHHNAIVLATYKREPTEEGRRVNVQA